MVDFPEPEKPVKKTVKPCLERGGLVRRNSLTTSGKENHSGISRPSDKTAAQFCAGDIEDRDLILVFDLVDRFVLRALCDPNHVFEIDHFAANF